jgi:hypothetical protein
MSLIAWHWGDLCNSEIPGEKKEVHGTKIASQFRSLARSSGSNSTLDQLARMSQDTIRLNLEDMCTRGVEALLDTPAEYMFDELAAAFPRAAVVLTTRNSTNWAEHRLHEHASGFVCRESVESFLALRSKTRNDEKLSNEMLLKPALPHAFALRACAERAASRTAMFPPRHASHTVHPWMVVHEFKNHTSATAAKDSIALLSAFFEEYNAHVSHVARSTNRTFVEVNVWEDEPCAIHASLEAAFRRTLDPSFRSTLFGVPVGKRLSTHKSKTSERARSCGDGGNSSALESRKARWNIMNLKRERRAARVIANAFPLPAREVETFLNNDNQQ